MLVYIISLILAVLISAYFYIEMHKRKAIQEKKKAIALFVATINKKFKRDLNYLVKQEILTIKESESLYRIAHHFFIFQPTTGNSMQFFELLLNSIISAIPNTDANSLHFEELQEQISLFVRSLPVAAKGYNATFYRKELPRLIKRLISAKESIYKVVERQLT